MRTCEKSLYLYPRLEYKDRLLEHITTGQIKLLDYSNLFDPRDERYYLSVHDGHPSYRANKVITEHIVKDLNLK